MFGAMDLGIADDSECSSREQAAQVAIREPRPSASWAFPTLGPPLYYCRPSRHGEWSIAMKATKKRPFNVNKFLATVDGGRTITNYGKNQAIFSQGDAADSVFYIQEGKVKVTVRSDQGKEAVVAIHGKGDFFGEGGLNGQPLRLASAVAMTDSAIMRFTKASIVRVLHEQPKFAERFMSHLLARNARVEADLVDQLFNSSEKRLARALLLMANFGKEESPEPIIAKVSQETLAEMVGTTRARVNTFMNRFRKLGFIEYNGDMKVHPSLLNVVLHN
jgi:CRP/FNR family cyclic AMP-dependent transcriptional regulator